MSLSHLILYLLLSELVVVILLSHLPQSTLCRFLGFSLVVQLTYCALRSPTGDAFTDYSVGCIVATRAVANGYLVFLANPLDNFRHEKDNSSPRGMSFWEKLWWTMGYVNNARGVGWNYQAGHAS